MNIKFRNQVLLVMLLPFLFVTLANAQEGQGTATDNWQRYELGKKTFSVLLPGKPTESIQSKPASDGQLATEMYLYALPTEGGVFVAQVTFIDSAAERWDANATESFYQGIWKGLKNGLDAQLKKSNIASETTLVKRQAVTFADSSGVEFLFTSGSRHGRLFVTLVGSRSFAGMILGSENITDQLQDKFFQSFVILPNSKEL
jgi:hypothetical protein